ncbi:hypothetical protein [Rhizobium sp. CCGE 510]|uniref:hypothetical protein n=1 Tax=Rhizobium sp. CCGE 510 TaxID=1132836 RepID=UPI00027B7B79|nr:hypothetical protein [Rhizobium sp. CCGE 510]EJT04927.1 hypothetical protein RCCGE510_12366 [Rhizobium sp. CCGE 510]
MDMRGELSHLQDRAQSLDRAVRDIDHDIDRALDSVATGQDTARILAYVRERQNTQLGFMYDLGKTEARIEDLQHRIREQEERGGETRSVEVWEREAPVAGEDHLDWLRPTLDARDTSPERDDRHPQRDGEERLLEEMHREDVEPEDHLDWWKRG